MKFLAVSALIVAAAAAPAYAPPPSTYPAPSAPDAPSRPGAPAPPAGSDYPKPGSPLPAVPTVPTITKPGPGSPGSPAGPGSHGHDGKPGQPFINAPVDGTIVAPVSGNNIQVGKNILQNNNGGKGPKGGDSPYPSGSGAHDNHDKPHGDDNDDHDKPHGGDNDDHDKPHGGDNDDHDKPHGGDDKPPAGGSDGDKPEYAVPRSFINVPVKAGVLAPVTANNIEVVKNVAQKNARRAGSRLADVDADVKNNHIANGIVNSGKVQARYAPPAPAGAVPHGTAVNAPVDATVIAPVAGNNVEVAKNIAQNNQGPEAWKGGYPHVPAPATEDPDYHLPKPAAPAEPKAEYHEPRSEGKFVDAPAKIGAFVPVVGNNVEVGKNILQENKVNKPRSEGKFINLPIDATIVSPIVGNKAEVGKNILQSNKVNKPRSEGKFVNAPVDATLVTPIVGNNVEVAKNILQKNGGH